MIEASKGLSKKRTPQDATLIHGGAGAERRLSTGAELVGVAKECELQIGAEVDKDGVAAVYRRRALRLQAACDLYWAAIVGATDIESLDALVKRWGWLQNSALRAFEILRQVEAAAARQDAGVVVAEMRERYSDANDQ